MEQPKQKINLPPSNKKEKESITFQKLKKIIHRKHYSKFSLQYYKEWYKYKFMKRKLFMVIMKLRNGNFSTFSVAINGTFFTRWGGSYFVDSDLAKRDLETGFNLLFYHQDCSLPFDIDYNIDALMKGLKTQDESIVKTSNPRLLKGFIESEVIEKVMKGAELSDQLKKVYMIAIMILVLNVVVVIMVAKSQGWI